MLTDQGILDRRSKYPCCAIGYMHRAVKAWDRGEAECGEENYEKAIYMLWASRIMCATPIESDADPGCTSNATATEWAKHADCLCAPCECPEPDTDCDLVPVYTVLEALAFDDLPIDPEVDDAYFIISGTNAGRIATWDGADWVFTSAGLLQLIWATVTNDYWAAGVGGFPGPWFPPPYMLNLIPNIWSATTEYVFMYQGRDIQLQLLGPNGWYNAAEQTNESSLPQLVNLTGLPIVGNESVRWRYIDGDCEYFSEAGSFLPPVNPPAPCDIVPDFTVTQLVDANQEGSLLPAGPWFIATNTFSVTNGWSSHVGDIVNTDLTFTTVALGETVYDLQFSEYWTVTSAGIGPLFPNLTLTYGVGQYTVSSQYPAISAVGTRLVLIVADDGTIAWGGSEDQLPSTLPFTGQFSEPITAIYFYDGLCQFETPVGVVYPDPNPVSILCDNDNLYQYRYTSAIPQQILITAPIGQTVFLSFAAGQMDVGTTIFVYDGATNADPLLASGSYTDLAVPPLQLVSTGQNMLIDILPSAAMPDNLQTWQFQASCVWNQFAAAPVVTDDCLTYQYNVSADVIYGGGVSYSFEVYLNASPTPITFGPYSGDGIIYDLGDYPIGSIVSVIMRNDADPTDYLWLGYLQTNGTCPDDPCAPIPDFWVRLYLNCDLIPVDGSPFPGIIFVSTTENCFGIPAGEPFTWDVGLGQYIQYATTVGQILIDSLTGEYYVVTANGETPYFQLTIAAPTGNSPLNWTFWMPAIQQFGLTTNRPVAIQTSIDGVSWTTVWTGTEQQLATQDSVQVAISQPMNQIRSLWFPDVCAYVGPVTILT